MAYIYRIESRLLKLEAQKTNRRKIKQKIDAEDRIKRGVSVGIGYVCQSDLLRKLNLTAAIVKASNFLICL